MFERFRKSPYGMLWLGVTLGLLFGVGMTIGVLVGVRMDSCSPSGWPETLLHATATHGGDSLAIATGPIDDDAEGLFVLDFLTGDLQCAVLNAKSLQLGGLFGRNIVRDLGIEQGKAPKYLMVTGQINARVAGGGIRPAQSVVYVADANTGRYAAYILPWNPSAASYNVPQRNSLMLMGTGVSRKVQVE